MRKIPVVAITAIVAMAAIAPASLAASPKKSTEFSASAEHGFLFVDLKTNSSGKLSYFDTDSMCESGSKSNPNVGEVQQKDSHPKVTKEKDGAWKLSFTTTKGLEKPMHTTATISFPKSTVAKVTVVSKSAMCNVDKTGDVTKVWKSVPAVKNKG